MNKQHEGSFSKENECIHKCFALILSSDTYSDYVSDIIQLIIEDRINVKNIDEVLNLYRIKHISYIKDELMDVIIRYVKLALKDHVISDYEKESIGKLKLFFRIREGDFYQYKYNEIREIVETEFQRLYADNKINKEEALHRFELQDIFDLSYDQLDELKEKEVKRALDEGAHINDLDTARFPKDYNK